MRLQVTVPWSCPLAPIKESKQSLGPSCPVLWLVIVSASGPTFCPHHPEPIIFFHIINYFYEIIFPCPQPVAQHPVLGHPHQPGPVRQRGLGQQAVLRAGRQDDGNKNNITSPESNPSFASWKTPLLWHCPHIFMAMFQVVESNHQQQPWVQLDLGGYFNIVEVDWVFYYFCVSPSIFPCQNGAKVIFLGVNWRYINLIYEFFLPPLNI